MDATQPADSRQLRHDFKEVTQGVRRFESAEEVFATFTAPLSQWTGEEGLPPSLRAYTRSSTAPASSSSSQSASIDVLLIEVIQEALLTRITVDWSSALDEVQFRDLINTWIFGPPTQPHKQGIIQQCSLRTISRLLPTKPHPLASALLEQLCVRALSLLSLASLLAAVTAEPNTARADVAWTETLRLLSSLPDRLANATEGKLPFTPHVWIERVLVSGLARCLASGMQNVQTRRLKDVVVRLEKMGYLGSGVHTEGSGFWVVFLRLAMEQRQQECLARAGLQLRSKLGSRLRMKLDLGLIETLQYLLVVSKRMPIGLVTSVERGKAGTEGSAFLGTVSQEGVAAVALILRTFVSSPPSGALSPGLIVTDSGSDSNDGDDEADPTSRTISAFKTLALSIAPQSPLLAWSWCVYLSSQLATDSLCTCLEATLSRWADTARIRRSLLTEELFLTTLIVCLLAAIPSDTSPASALPAIARSRTVLDGVSAHLEHSDATVRRLGMLVAELLSAKTTIEGSGKVLNFGSGIWNGAGEGREEARVLRALSDAWSHHVVAVGQVEKGWGADAIAEAVKVLGVIPLKDGGVGIREQDQIVVERRSKKASKPKTRRLPERVEPPSRMQESGRPARPLITMLDSDDETEGKELASSPPLKMFSHPQRSPSRQSVSSSSSSSDDSDSDVAPTDSNSIHRLAASLSGLSPTESNSLLSSQPSPLAPKSKSSRGQASEIDNFEANPESHAPQFHTKTATPVYVSQLSPLLRSASRSDIRLALHNAAPLIRRKSSTQLFGAEVGENAVDLCLTLVALHDNFGIKRFEAMRRDAVGALAAAVPRVVVGVLAEQSFGSQYSDVQRMSMWAGIVQSAVVLAQGHGGVDAEEQEEVGEVEQRADRVGAAVIRGAREVGEQRVPQMRRERQLQVKSTVSKGRGKLVQLQDSSTLGERATVADEQEWVTLAGALYIFPLIHRFLAYHSYRSSSSSSRRLGAGTSALFTPTTQALFLDTLTVLVSLAPGHTIEQASPSVLELLSALTTTTASETAPVTTCSALTLLALVLDRALNSHPAALLNAACARWLAGLVQFTQDVFAQLQQGQAAGEAGALAMKITARAAAVLLLIDRLEQARADEVRRLIGFVPA
ncbi:hypothetical protein EX895_005257 [Sporisorium graminicola]|uniref:Telomere length regulation protein conserved domain-containing protein n=1 Tax=Sporisorium graminicola TaxID=280036 RepID=A0A4U7KPF0_9BASI|nr:hypothetical protein EX895_005257 [Sporisorium graminicola]TKY85717.1 hypothetical protein EX895_005257 [Sporisorium graminicola]